MASLSINGGAAIELKLYRSYIIGREKCESTIYIDDESVELVHAWLVRLPEFFMIAPACGEVLVNGELIFNTKNVNASDAVDGLVRLHFGSVCAELRLISKMPDEDALDSSGYEDGSQSRVARDTAADSLKKVEAEIASLNSTVNTTDDSFNVPATQALPLQLRPSLNELSKTGASDDDFFIPETQDIIGHSSVVQLNQSEISQNVSEVGSQIRILTQDFDDDASNDHMASSLILGDIMLISPKSNIQEEDKTNASELEMSRLDWTAINSTTADEVSRNGACEEAKNLSQMEDLRSAACTPDLLDVIATVDDDEQLRCCTPDLFDMPALPQKSSAKVATITTVSNENNIGLNQPSQSNVSNSQDFIETQLYPGGMQQNRNSHVSSITLEEPLCAAKQPLLVPNEAHSSLDEQVEPNVSYTQDFIATQVFPASKERSLHLPSTTLNDSNTLCADKQQVSVLDKQPQSSVSDSQDFIETQVFPAPKKRGLPLSLTMQSDSSTLSADEEQVPVLNGGQRDLNDQCQSNVSHSQDFIETQVFPGAKDRDHRLSCIKANVNNSLRAVQERLLPPNGEKNSVPSVSITQDFIETQPFPGSKETVQLPQSKVNKRNVELQQTVNQKKLNEKESKCKNAQDSSEEDRLIGKIIKEYKESRLFFGDDIDEILLDMTIVGITGKLSSSMLVEQPFVENVSSKEDISNNNRSTCTVHEKQKSVSPPKLGPSEEYDSGKKKRRSGTSKTKPNPGISESTRVRLKRTCLVKSEANEQEENPGLSTSNIKAEPLPTATEVPATTRTRRKRKLTAKSETDEPLRKIRSQLSTSVELGKASTSQESIRKSRSKRSCSKNAEDESTNNKSTHAPKTSSGAGKMEAKSSSKKESEARTLKTEKELNNKMPETKSSTILQNQKSSKSAEMHSGSKKATCEEKPESPTNIKERRGHGRTVRKAETTKKKSESVEQTQLKGQKTKANSDIDSTNQAVKTFSKSESGVVTSSERRKLTRSAEMRSDSKKASCEENPESASNIKERRGPGRTIRKSEIAKKKSEKEEQTQLQGRKTEANSDINSTIQEKAGKTISISENDVSRSAEMRSGSKKASCEEKPKSPTNIKERRGPGRAARKPGTTKRESGLEEQMQLQGLKPDVNSDINSNIKEKAGKTVSKSKTALSSSSECRKHTRSAQLPSGSKKVASEEHLEVASLSKESLGTERAQQKQLKVQNQPEFEEDTQLQAISDYMEQIKRSGRKIKITISMCDRAELDVVLKSIAGMLEVTEDPLQSDVLIMDRGERTYKLLVALASSRPILCSKWLHDVMLTRSVDVEPIHIFCDQKFIKSYMFNPLNVFKKRRILNGYDFFLCEGIQPNVNEMRCIITSAGGTVHANLSGISGKHQLYVVARKQISHDFSSHKNIRVIKTEAIMQTLVQQNVALIEKYNHK